MAMMTARPYAQALFAYAQEHHQVSEFSSFLKRLQAVVLLPELRQLIQNPRYQDQLVSVIRALMDRPFREPEQNFLNMLVAYKRLGIVADIQALFEELWSRSIGLRSVQVACAQQLSLKEQQMVQTQLEEHLKSQVVVTFFHQPELLDGLTIRIGDQVVDGSLRGQLLRLKKRLLENDE